MAPRPDPLQAIAQGLEGYVMALDRLGGVDPEQWQEAHVAAWRLVARLEAIRPDPDESVLVGLAEMGEILGVSRQRVDQLGRTKGFPEPVDVISAGRIWLRSDVEEWHRARASRGG